MSWMDDRDRGSWFDTMQVCMSGHVISANSESEPESKQQFCARCGEATTTACPSCQTKINGQRHSHTVAYVVPRNAPAYCTGCGKPMPWQSAKLDSLREILVIGGISEGDVQTVNDAMKDVANETPKSEVATLKVRTVLKKLGGDFYGIALKVVTDVASEYSKKMLGIDKTT